MGPEPLLKDERDNFKASLYIFLQKKLIDSLADAFERSKSAEIHSDISR